MSEPGSRGPARYPLDPSARSRSRPGTRWRTTSPENPSGSRGLPDRDAGTCVAGCVTMRPSASRRPRIVQHLSLLAGVAALIAACGSSSGSSGAGSGSDAGGCTGSTPACFGSDVNACCGQDPAGEATCVGGQWMCGSAAAPGCNGTSCLVHPDGGSSESSAGETSTDGPSDSAASDGSGSCTGQAPNCFGNDLHHCCGQDPAGPATCVNGQWMCGSAGAPGCNGTNCLFPDAGVCMGQAPNCYGNDVTMCCPQDPSGVATCQGNMWMCGSAPAPGCDGTSCVHPG
jgi:hypothetical protein